MIPESMTVKKYTTFIFLSLKTSGNHFLSDNVRNYILYKISYKAFSDAHWTFSFLKTREIETIITNWDIIITNWLPASKCTWDVIVNSVFCFITGRKGKTKQNKVQEVM